MPELVFLGPFLTRVQAARRAGLSTREVAARPDLLRIGGRWLEEVYFAFQFDERGIRRGLGSVVLSLRGHLDDETIADWLIRPNAHLGAEVPLRWEAGGRDLAQLHQAARAAAAGDDGSSHTAG